MCSMGRKIFLEAIWNVSVSVCTSSWVAKLVIQYALINGISVAKMIIRAPGISASQRHIRFHFGGYLLINIYHALLTFPARATKHSCLGKLYSRPTRKRSWRNFHIFYAINMARDSEINRLSLVHDLKYIDSCFSQ